MVVLTPTTLGLLSWKRATVRLSSGVRSSRNSSVVGCVAAAWVLRLAMRPGTEDWPGLVLLCG